MWYDVSLRLFLQERVKQKRFGPFLLCICVGFPMISLYPMHMACAFNDPTAITAVSGLRGRADKSNFHLRSDLRSLPCSCPHVLWPSSPRTKSN